MAFGQMLPSLAVLGFGIFLIAKLPVGVNYLFLGKVGIFFVFFQFFVIFILGSQQY